MFTQSVMIPNLAYAPIIFYLGGVPQLSTLSEAGVAMPYEQQISIPCPTHPWALQGSPSPSPYFLPLPQPTTGISVLSVVQRL